MDGYNSSILAYGQTGSGKTYTMFGSDISDTNNMGIIPRVAKDIFARTDGNTNFEIRIKMVEIYKE